MTTKSPSSAKPSAKPTRRPYSAPKLVSYGDAVSMTLASRRQGMKDGAAKGKSRTR